MRPVAFARPWTVLAGLQNNINNIYYSNYFCRRRHRPTSSSSSSLCQLNCLPTLVAPSSSLSLRFYSKMAQQQSGHEEDAYAKALASNRAWAQKTLHADAHAFERLAQGQQPGILWLGCADSRVPETTLLGLAPGDVFVHRNIANLYVPTDISAACVLEYGIKHLGVRHVVLCGHTHCGGVKGALGAASLATLDVWLAPLRALRLECAAELAAAPDDDARVRLLVERSVQRGVQLLRQNPHVLHAMHTRGLRVHGVVFNIATGLLEEVPAATATSDDAASKEAGAHLFNIQ